MTFWVKNITEWCVSKNLFCTSLSNDQIIYRYLFASSSTSLVSRSLYQLSFTGIRCSSANVFNALTWSWSSKSLQCTRSAAEFCGPSEPCRLGAHSITLEKLYVEEQRLYKDIKVCVVLMKWLHKSTYTFFIQAIALLDDLYLFHQQKENFIENERCTREL